MWKYAKGEKMGWGEAGEGTKMIVIVPRSGLDIHEKTWTGKIGVFF